MTRTRGARPGTLRTIASWGLIVAVGSLAAYGLWTLRRANRLYAFLKDGERGWTSRVFRADDALGFAPVAGSIGGELLPHGPPIPVRFDADGFRVPEHADPGDGRRRPLVLALGDSFTYGAACPAEAAYPHVVAEALQGSALNAGLPSYGLSQMLILARRLIPRHAPDYVLVQHSNVLVTRAQERYPKSFFGVWPTPFFVGDAAGPRLHPPLFRARALELPLPEFRGTRRGAADYGAFLLRAGLPLLVHDDVSLGLAEAGRRLGFVPNGSADAELIVSRVYAEIEALCRAAGGRMLVVLLGRAPSPQRLLELQRHGSVVDAELALCRAVDAGCQVPQISEAYLRAYGHFRGSPPVFVDSHPNPRAHAVIAAEIVAAIRSR